MGNKLPAAVANDIVTFAPSKSEVGALALITLDPAKYVAEVFKPYRTKLDALKAEAALIHFKDDRMRDEPHKFVDISTVAGMDIAIKYRAAFRDDVRIAAEKTRVVRKAPMLAIGKLLDSEYKALELDAGPFEARFDDAIREETKRKEAIKAAKELAEAERVAAIRAKIAEITGLLTNNASATSDELTAVLQVLATREIGQEEFAELTNEARTAVEYVAVELMALRDAAVAREKAEADRLAELAAEKKRNADQAEANRLAAIENERIANEQAIEAKRLADLAAAQEAAAAALRAKAEANLRAEREAQETAIRLERERNAAEQAKAAADLKAAQDALAAQVAAHEAAVKLEADHAEALEMNVAINAERHARAQAMVDQAIVDAAAMPATLNELMAATLPRPESVSEHDAMVDAGFDEGPSDNEIIDAVMTTFGWSYDEATKRLTTIDYAAAWAERVEMEA
jgi:hypothetical protein